MVVLLHMYKIFLFCYKDVGHTHRYKFGFEKKNQVKSPSICSRTPKSVRIRQSGWTGNRGVTSWPEANRRSER